MKVYTLVNTKNGLTLCYPRDHEYYDAKTDGAVMFETMNDAMRIANIIARDHDDDVTDYIIVETDSNAIEVIH